MRPTKVPIRLHFAQSDHYHVGDPIHFLLSDVDKKNALRQSSRRNCMYFMTYAKVQKSLEQIVRHILKYRVESTFGVEPWSGVGFFFKLPRLNAADSDKYTVWP